ncbi:MAG: repeat protein [Mucilaginibacter sp.]|nr:repeat protein [Mucilaginibacter sp.]
MDKKKINYWILLLGSIWLLTPDYSIGQTCLHSDLSKKFDFKITRVETKHPGASSLFGKSKITLEIYTKKDKRLFQSIQFASDGLYANDFKICSSERSLITGKNKNSEISDLDYGDIVVADFNFDGKEDIAIKHQWEGNIGVGYYFYIQAKNAFKEDKYLNDEVVFFPWLIKSKQHILITTVSPTPGTTIRQYKYNRTKRSWRKINTRFVYHDENIENILKALKR